MSAEQSGKLAKFRTIGRVITGLKKLSAMASQGKPQRDDEELFGNLVLVRQSPLSLIKMSKRILELRNEHIELGEVFDMGNSLQRLETNVSHMVIKSHEFYAQR